MANVRSPGGVSLLGVGLLLILAGSFTAHRIQTAGGTRVLDVRFAGNAGNLMSGLLYIPRNATQSSPAPAVLAVHGYFNSRETQGDFAIEFARRGYVVLAMDQPGHGLSDPPAFANRFGGPDGLGYLRSLRFVDRDNIGLEGHSMGGWAVVNAAAAIPDGYRAMVLEGSSTGAPFGPEGSPLFPRNIAVVFSKLDEFSQVMWGIPSGAEVTQSKKLWKLFGADQPVEPGRLYGSIQQGTGRMLYTPPGTHPMDHISATAIGDSIDWFQRTLRGGTPKRPSDQIWPWREFGTLLALIGFVIVLLGALQLLLALPYFAPITGVPWPGRPSRDAAWWIALILGTALPALTLLPFFQVGGRWFPASHWLPQAFTNEIATWALLNTLVLTLLGIVPGMPRPTFNTPIRRCIVLALLTVGIGYLAVAAADFFFKVDFRFWFVAFKLMSVAQAKTFLVYLVPFTVYLAVALRALHTALPVRTDSRARSYLINLIAFAAGVLLFLAFEYGSLVSTHQLQTWFMNDALRIIVAINFVPLLSIVAIISTFAFHRTNSYLPGAFVGGLLVAWYAVVGQATQAP
jgi:pimeloyl-ACP methyl ester carboxylesterase